MKLKHKYSGEEFTAEQLPETRKVELDTPAGGKDTQEMGKGMFIITCEGGKRYAVHPKTIAEDYEELE